MALSPGVSLWLLLTRALLVRRNPEVSNILNREAGRTDQPVETAATYRQDVVDDVIGRRNLAVAVVPGELNKL